MRALHSHEEYIQVVHSDDDPTYMLLRSSNQPDAARQRHRWFWIDEFTPRPAAGLAHITIARDEAGGPVN